MQILIHADHNVAQTGKSNETIERAVRSTANRFDTQITPVDLYLNDVNCTKGGANDKRCVFEVRPAGLDPLAVNHHASTIEFWWSPAEMASCRACWTAHSGVLAATASKEARPASQSSWLPMQEPFDEHCHPPLHPDGNTRTGCDRIRRRAGSFPSRTCCHGHACGRTGTALGDRCAVTQGHDRHPCRGGGAGTRRSRPQEPGRCAGAGSQIDHSISHIVANCKLDSQADAALHGIIAKLAQGTAALKADPNDMAAITTLRSALRDYPRLFDDPGWSAYEAAR